MDAYVTAQRVETFIMLLSAVALLVHGIVHIVYFISARHKLPAHWSRLSHFYPDDYKRPTQWIIRGAGGVISFVLGVALLMLSVQRLRSGS